jgi:hypothetical protein
MENYKPVSWTSEPISLDKLQDMLQNDQTVADEVLARPRGILGCADLTMYASNTATKGYRDVTDGFNAIAFTSTKNPTETLRDWSRVYDNWQINPNGLSVSVNVLPARIIQLQLYIPLLSHGNPKITDTTTPGGTVAEATNDSSWAISGFKFVRDGVDITSESWVDIWTVNNDVGGAGNDQLSRSTHSFYMDAIDFDPGQGPHIYEVMWKSENALALEIWEQNRNTYNSRPSGTSEPDQYIYNNWNYGEVTAAGKYNLSDFTQQIGNNPPTKQTYTGATNSIPGFQPVLDPETWSNFDSPFAGSIPTAQFIVSDCGSVANIIYYKEDDIVQGEKINADPTA